jgi:regulator of nucleoside diphosphate kinase
VSETSARLSCSERERLKRFVTAWENRLTVDGEHVAALRARLESASVVSAAEVPGDLVTLHSQVLVRDIESGRTFFWTVFLPADEEVATTARSPLSWSGATMLGRRSGDEFEWRSRSDSRRVRIEAVLFQPKATQGDRSEVGDSRAARREPAQCTVGRRQSSESGKRSSKQRAANAIGSEAART